MKIVKRAIADTRPVVNGHDKGPFMHRFFLGECIVSATTGKWEWAEQEKDWCVAFSSGAKAFPFHKVWKQLKDGREAGESILGFYNVTINFVATGKLFQKSQQESERSD